VREQAENAGNQRAQQYRRGHLPSSTLLTNDREVVHRDDGDG
jgi:hypothetical protein